MSPTPRCLALVLFASAAGPVAWAQPAPAAAEAAPSERAKRDADKVREMILLHADKPRKARAEERAGAGSTSATPATAPTRATGSIAPAAAAPPKAAPVAAAGAPAVRRVEEPVAAAETSKPAAAMPKVEEPAPAPATPLATALPAAPSKPPAGAPALGNKLELVKGVEPSFPRRLVQSVRTGSISVAFDVLPDGSVTAVQVLRSPHPGLNAAAMEAVAQWRFRPIAERASGVTEFSLE